LVHGISTDAPWYEETNRILSRLFEVVELRYDHYRNNAPLKLVGNPPTLARAGTIAAVVGGAVAGVAPLVWGIAGAAGIAFAGLGIAQWRARSDLDNALEHFIAERERALGGDRRAPHLIAHSLGSWLSIRAAERYPGVRFRRVVLCGSVLPRAFPWAALVNPSGNAPAIRAVRNEVGLRDWVPLLAGLLQRAAPHFGGAGRWGFIGPTSVVHTQEGARHPCSACGPWNIAPVHNVPLPFSHSAGFAGGSQCKTAWVPFLLGYDPIEYNQLMDLCDQLHEARAPWERTKLESELFAHEWRWANGSLVARAMEFLLEAAPQIRWDPRAGDIVLVALGVFWRTLADALHALPDDQDSIFRALDLHAALRNAVHAVLDQIAL
jgi:pimeloyl-ACP methyl ester carboxylesterase